MPPPVLVAPGEVLLFYLQVFGQLRDPVGTVITFQDQLAVTIGGDLNKAVVKAAVTLFMILFKSQNSFLK